MSKGMHGGRGGVGTGTGGGSIIMGKNGKNIIINSGH